MRSVFQGDERCSPTAAGFVPEPETGDERGAAEEGVDGFAKRARAFAVDDADAEDAAFETGFEIGRDHGGDFARGKGVEIEFARDRNADGRGVVVGGVGHEGGSGRRKSEGPEVE